MRKRKKKHPSPFLGQNIAWGRSILGGSGLFNPLLEADAMASVVLAAALAKPIFPKHQTFVEDFSSEWCWYLPVLVGQFTLVPLQISYA